MQFMERDNKWKGLFEVTRIVSRFQIEYRDGEEIRKAHVRYCKKFVERDSVGIRKVMLYGDGRKQVIQKQKDLERLIR